MTTAKDHECRCYTCGHAIEDELIAELEAEVARLRGLYTESCDREFDLRTRIAALEAKLAALVEAAERVVADTLNWNVNAADLIKLDQAISAAKEKPNG